MKGKLRKGFGANPIFALATVDEEGQIVIPAETRKELCIQAGDKMLFLQQSETGSLLVVKFDAVKGLYETGDVRDQGDGPL